MTDLRPTRPRYVPEHAEACLQALAEHGLGHLISLGGALGLLHYVDYRRTDDVDAWWAAPASPKERQKLVQMITEALQLHGEVKVRAWGEVVSVELIQKGKKVFSFQIAERSAQLEPPQPAPWAGLFLDSFADLLASKMVALVERGAPRDFRDVYTVCQVGLATPEECWRLWRDRQHLAGAETETQRARLAVETHLARIVRHRPLEQINDAQQRSEAERVRTWFKTELLDALVD